MIHRYDSEQGRYIHDWLVEEIIEGDRVNQVIIIDPDTRHKPRVQINTRTLKESISPRFGRETGFIVISKT